MDHKIRAAPSGVRQSVLCLFPKIGIIARIKSVFLLPSACCVGGQAWLPKTIPVFRGTEQSGNPASLVLSPGHLGSFNSCVEHRANESCSWNIPTPTTGLFKRIVRRSAEARSWIRDALGSALLLAVIAAAVPDAASAQGICSRADGVENRIMMQLKLIHGFDGTCSDVTDTDLAKLTYLELSGSSSNEAVSSLSRGDFAGLTGVKELLLWDQSDLRSLPADVFEGLENVEDMWIKPSSIQRISAGAFRGLSKLKLLVIDNDETNEPGEGQRLTNLAPGAFEGLTSLEMLIISDHALNSLPLEELEALRPNPGSLKFYEQRADHADPMLLRVTPMALTIPAGESKTYRIGLSTSAQVYTKVTFNVPEGLTVSPTEVVFPYNHPDWFRRHEITVTVAAGTAPGTLTITHNNTMHNLHVLDEPAPAVTITVPGAVSQPAISIDDASGDEGETLEFEVTLSKQSSQTVTVEWDTRGGTATEDVDFTGDLGTLTFLPNETSKTISIDTIEDEINDAGEQFTVVLSNPSRATIADGSAVGTINNTDLIPVPEISITDDRVTEGETLEFTVTLDQAFSETVTVDWATAAGSATEDTDYTGDSGRLTFAPNEQSKTIEVVTLEDDQNEGSETLTVVLSGASNATIGDGTGVGTIDNKVPDPAISITDARASEGDTLRFTVTLDRTSTEVVTVDWATSAVTATEDTDYSGASGRIPFAPNERSKTIEVTTFEDEENEVAETFTVELSNATNATISDASGTGTIDNKVPDPEISISDASASEGETLRFHVTLNRESSNTVTVNWNTTAGTATEDTDYDADNGTLTFNPGVTSKSIEVTTIEDQENEVAETFTVDLSSPTNATITDASGTGTIDNTEPDPEISITDARASEGETLRFHVTLNRESTSTVTVNWTTTAGTATEDTDYDAGNGTLTFIPGVTSKTIEVMTIEDEENEVAETFTVDLSSATNATITDASGTGTIDSTNSDPGISISDARASEGETLRFTVTLDKTSTSTVTVDWTTTEGTATEDVDYNSGSGQLSFLPTERSKTIEVTAINDEIDEGLETFTVDLSNPSNATVADGTATGIIDNTEFVPPPEPGLSIADARGVEGGTLIFQVILNQVYTNTVTVDWETREGTATEDTDYVGASGQLSFLPGDGIMAIPVLTIDDDHHDDGETFAVVLSNASGAPIVNGTATGTIDNQDVVPGNWIGRFGQAVGELVVKAVQVRMQPPRPPGVAGRIGGHTIQSEDTSSHKRDNDETTRLYGRDPVLQTDPEKFDRYSFSDPEVVPAYIPSDMSFVLTSESADGEGIISVWGQGSWSGFKDADVIDGKATTFMFGIDERKGKWLAGMAVGRSSGEGGWYGRDDRMGSLSLSLTGVYPYIGYNMSEQISIWGVAGYGSGDLQVVTPGDQTYNTDVSLAMAAAGTRIELLQNKTAPGPMIAVLADGMVTSMKSGAVPGLSATDGKRSRLRLGLESRWTFIQDGSTFEPRLEASARHDGGDGENGLGLEIGGGLAYSNADDTLIVDISGRSLVMNRNSRFREWGVSASVRYDPRPETDRGLSVSLSQTTGTGPAGSADELMTATAIEDISGGSATRASSMHAKAGYGLPAFGGSMTGIPWVGYDMSNDTNDVRLGWRLKPARRTKGSFEFNTEVQRRAEAEDTEAKYQYGFQIISRW